MKITAQRILLFLVGALAAWLVVGYYGGFFPRLGGQDTPQVVRADNAAVDPDDVDESADEAIAEASGNIGDDPTTDASREEAELAETIFEEASEPDAPDTASGEMTEEVAANDDVVVPTFDLLRVDPDGSMVIAGSAAPNSSVEIVAGSSVLATTKAAGNGDFASVLSLKPGEHTVVLRSTASDSVSATSLETAIVSVPMTPDGEVVALVQQPGQPSRLITLPETQPAPPESAEVSPGTPDRDEQSAVAQDIGAADKPAEVDTDDVAASASDEAGQVVDATPLSDGEYAGSEPAELQSSSQTAAAPEATDNSGQQDQQPQERRRSSPFIAAVEIDGRQIFIAGEGEPEKRVRVYANDVLLGQDKADRDGRFLVQTERDLPVGDYIIRADVLDLDEQTVTARAAVPFVREPGENLTSIADSSASNSMSDETETEDGSIPMAAPLRQDRAVIIRKGDTLWHISRRIYGLGTRYTTIYQANKEQIRDPDLIWPGQTFVLPETSNEGEAADLSSVGSSE